MTKTFFFWLASLIVSSFSSSKDGLILQATRFPNMIHSTHEVVCSNLKDEYKASDIKLDIEEQDKQLLFKYHGTATTFDGKTVDFEKEETVYFDLDAEITRHNSSS